MPRSPFLTLPLALLLGAGASAQVVTNGAYATTYPIAVSQQVADTVTTYGIPSVPAINTPVVHVGPQLQQPTAVTQELQETSNAEQGASAPAQPMNLGVASVDVNPFLSPEQTTSDRSLGEIARDLKQKGQSVNAKTYTNSDIDRINGASGVTGGATSANAQNDNWPANNGVITPEQNNGQGAIAAPAQNQSTTGNGPFSPKPQAAPGSDNSQPSNPPQAYAKPSGERPYEMAQNNPSNVGIPQQAEQSNNADETASSQKATLPKTASRLPLLGVLGFFSISMGLFVRYQRAKDAR